MAFLYAQSFPFCIQPEKETENIPTGSGTDYPFEMSLEDAMFLFWKAKTFKLDASLTSQTTINQDDVTTINLQGSVFASDSIITPPESGPYEWPEKMSQMICNPNEAPFPAVGSDTVISGSASGSIFAYGDLIDTALYVSSYLSLEMFLPYGNRIITKNKKYFPLVGITITPVGEFPDTATQFSFFAETKPQTSEYIIKTNAAKIKINNTEYITDLFVSSQLGGTYFIPDSASASLTLTPNDDRLTE